MFFAADVSTVDITIVILVVMFEACFLIVVVAVGADVFISIVVVDVDIDIDIDIVVVVVVVFCGFHTSCDCALILPQAAPLFNRFLLQCLACVIDVVMFICHSFVLSL